MKLMATLLSYVLISISLYASTGEAFYFFYPEYYEKGESVYEINFCHRNNAKLLRELKWYGANLKEIEVVIIQGLKNSKRLQPENTRFDSKYAWHVVLAYNGEIFDLNTRYNEQGIPIKDYFPFVFGSNIDLADILVRVIKGNEFYDYFYSEDGASKKYDPLDFVKVYLSKDAKTPLTTAKMLQWYFL